MNRTLGLVLMIVGVAGMVVSLLLIPAVWVERSAAITSMTDATDQVNASLQQLQDATVAFRGGIDTLRGPLQQVVGQTDSAAASGPVEQQLATNLLGVIDQTIAPAYQRLRDGYLSLREKVVGVAQAAAVVQRLVPGLMLPSLPTDEIVTVDGQLQSMDAAIRQARADLAAGTLPGAVPGIQQLRSVGEGLRGIDARLDTLGTTADDIGARAQQLQVALQQAAADFERAITILAVVLTLLCADLAGLNLGLFIFGRQLRSRIEPNPVSVASPPIVEREPSSVGA